MSFAEQVKTFRAAKLVVAPHGAAITNLLFAPPGGTLVELIAGFEASYFQKLSEAKRWRRIVIHDKKVIAKDTHNYDMTIDPAEIERTLEDIGF